MELRSAVDLIANAITNNNGSQTWADLGAGTGLFTRALSTLLPSGSLITAIDTDAAALVDIKSEDKNVHVAKQQADFTKPLDLRDLDGILMANALHFVKDKPSLLKNLSNHLVSGGKFVIIEYDLSSPNPWVPWPVTFLELKALAETIGFQNITKLAEYPSRYNQSVMYSAVLKQKQI